MKIWKWQVFHLLKDPFCWIIINFLIRRIWILSFIIWSLKNIMEYFLNKNENVYIWINDNNNKITIERKIWNNNIFTYFFEDFTALLELFRMDFRISIIIIITTERKIEIITSLFFHTRYYFTVTVTVVSWKF